MEQLRIMLDDLPEPGAAPGEDEPFRTSVTGLVTLAGCPLRYFWSDVERLPRRPTSAARRGVEIHRRIELHNRGSVAFDEADESFYDAVDTAPAPVTSAFDRFTGSRFAVSTPILVEAPFDLAIGEARVSGRIDAVYEDEPGTWEVVDFKSGRPSTDPARRVQLQAYAVAADEAGLAAGRSPEHTRVTFAYLGGDALVEETEDVDGPWLEEARSRLGALVEQASSGPYDAAPSPACRSCDFTRFCEAGTAWLEAQA